jgi:hypothetical protein
MMKKSVVLCAALVVSSMTTMRAQHVPAFPYDGHGQRGGSTPTDQTRHYDLTLFTPIEGHVVKGAPYSAEVVSESIQVLQDGNRIVQRTTGRVYRDSDGRVRREQDQPSGPPSVTISDPVAGKSFTLNQATRQARQNRAFGIDLPQYFVHLSGQESMFSRSYLWSSLTGSAPRAGEGVLNEEKLPDRTIEGVNATGVRRTTTIAAGAIGNEKPIRIVSEEWRSPDLQVLVLTDLNDPRSGRSTYKLLKINRAEPDPALFKVPGDYTVQRGGEPLGRHTP